MGRPTGGGSRPSGGGHSSSRNSGGHRVGGGNGRPTGSSPFNFNSGGSHHSGSDGLDAWDAMLLGSALNSISREIQRSSQHNREMERAREREEEREREHQRRMERERERERERELEESRRRVNSYTPTTARYDRAYDGASYDDMPRSLNQASTRHRSVDNSTNFGGSSPSQSFGGSMGGTPTPPAPPAPPSSTSGSNQNHSEGKKPASVILLSFARTLLAVLGLSFIVLSAIAFVRNDDGREAKVKLEGTSFSSDCIEDYDGWFSSPKKMAKELQKVFYKKTGIQPYIVINEYMPYFNSDADKQAYAEEWYAKNIANEYTFLFMYFPESDPNRIGYMSYVNGKEVLSIMDSEVIEHFWNLMDKYWESAPSTESLFKTVYGDTADFAMKEVKSSKDVAISYGIQAMVMFALFSVLTLICSKINRDAERARETERILNSDIDSLADEELLRGSRGE